MGRTKRREGTRVHTPKVEETWDFCNRLSNGYLTSLRAESKNVFLKTESVMGGRRMQSRSWIRKLGWVVAGMIGLVFLLVGAVQGRFLLDSHQTYTSASFDLGDVVRNADLQLGHRIYHVRGGCVDCHGVDLAGAKLMEDPAMGSIHGANLTPFNLKAWSDEEIVRAIRYGVHRTGRSLQFMPSFDYEKMSLSDIGAVVAYLRSVPSVDRPSHANQMGPVLKVLSFIRQVPALFPAQSIDQSQGFATKPMEAPTVEFGQYLAHACAGCHGAEFKGGKIPGGDPSWPAASNIRLGANSAWNESAFKSMLVTGVSPTSGQKLRAPMPIALLAQLNETEQTALWRYLSSLK